MIANAVTVQTEIGTVHHITKTHTGGFMNTKLLKVTVRASGNPVYFGRTFVGHTKTEFSYKGRPATGVISPKQRYMKLSPISI